VIKTLSLRWLAAGYLALIAGPLYAQQEVKIAVLNANHSKQRLQEHWAPLVTAMNKSLPDYRFVIEFYNHDELKEVVATRQADFVLTNPSSYLLMYKRSGLSPPLVTLSSLEQGNPVSAFGGVIFTLTERTNINKLEDLRGKSIAIADINAFGGYQMQAFELNLLGINPQNDAQLLVTGQPHDSVLNAVLSKRADVGFVRTGVLESLASEGKLDLNKITIVNQQNLPGYPVRTSTRLYPDWPLSALPQTNNQLKRKVASFLLSLRDNRALVQQLQIQGFDVPANYTPVEEMLHALNLPPFDMEPEFTLHDVWERYYLLIVSAVLAAILIMLLGLSTLLVNRKLKDRSRELKLANIKLQEDMVERKAIEKKSAEMKEQLAQSSKMESIGHLTAGIAHDFNNILGAMMGYTELSQLKLAAGKLNDIRYYLEEIYKSGTRAKELIRQLLTFSRLSPSDTGDKKTITVFAPVIKEVLSMLRSSTPSTIELNCNINNADLKARILPVNLHQILLNLIVNARDAVGEYGRIDVTLTQMHYEHKLCSACMMPIGGDFAQITVHDNGSSIPQSILNKVFDPFFTTKGLGKGTGMGLSVVHGLVHAQAGHILVQSSAKTGTSFHILFPIELEEAKPQGTSDTISSASNIKGIKIMVVDDEPAIANMLIDFLSAHGAHIIAFTDPAQALEEFQKNGANTEMVITDETMPGMSGMSLSEKLLKLKPELQIILCTGFSDHATPEAAAQIGIAGFFNKPFNMNKLLDKIEVLRKSRSR
jgi:signal transduction histidine kinase/CheY-like chemotaxis protein